MSEYLLGIGYFDAYLKIACLKKEGKKYRLHSLERLTIPQNKAEEASKIFAQWASDNLPSESQVRVVLTLPESLIFLKELELPKVKEKGLSEAIYWEISSVVPISPEEAVIQWKKISEEEKLVRLAAIIVKNQTARDLSLILKKTDFQLLAIEPSSLAFSRLFKTKLEKNTLLVVVEDQETNFIILKNGAPVFSNAISISLVGMKTKKRKMNKEITSALASNAKKVISFWEAKEEGKVQQVIVTGEGVRYYGLARVINNRVNIPVLLGKSQAFPKIETSTQPKAIVNRYLIPIGAAARPLFEEWAQEVNLLPKKERKAFEKEKSQKKIVERILFFSKITLVFFIVNLLLLTGIKFWDASLAKEVAQTKLFVNNHPAQKLIPEIQHTNQLISQVDWLMESQKDTGERLRQISQLTPINIRFTSVDFTELQQEEWTIAGVGDRDDILAFYGKLKADSGASQVIMPYSNLQKEKEGDFKITIIW